MGEDGSFTSCIALWCRSWGNDLDRKEGKLFFPLPCGRVIPNRPSFFGDRILPLLMDR